ncbi:MAG: hypothetical protein GY703_15860 [Gammaproteobacteria bacterium]|nr:hypothetical protein [Gammaproteobacteria bacterium]
MSDPKEKITLDDADKKRSRATGQRHVFQLEGYTVHWLEVEDVLFHHNSAVLLPEVESRLTSSIAKQRQLGGLSVLRACYLHAKHHDAQKLLIAGHTDTSGGKAYNLELSQLRAAGVEHLLLGERDPWVAVVNGKHKVEDYQHILTWVARWKKWGCDPQGIDDKNGPNTKAATKAFQQHFSDADFGEPIAVDGVVGKQTWGAFFKLYIVRLAGLLDTDDAGLAEYREALTWLDDSKRGVGCGEHFPIDAPGRDHYRSQANRRLELMFFDPGEEPPKLNCHPGKDCVPSQCRIYNPKIYQFKYIVPADLAIVKVDDWFAPEAEKLDILYKIEGLAGAKVVLEVHSAQAKGNPLYTYDLTVGEKKDGQHTIHWDGKANGGGDELKGRFITPLLSPLRVRLTDGGFYGDSEDFNLLYHSIMLRQGPLTPDEKVPDEADEKTWVQYQLSQLGYFGGPVGADFDDYLKKAVIRYKANNKGLHQLKYSDYDAGITSELKSALKKGESRREYITGDAITDSNKEGRIFVEALTYEAGEFSQSKATKERERLNRPLIPIEAVVLLKKKNGSGVLAPKAVGSVRINWRFSDPQEDLSAQYAATAGSPSKTRKYVEKALKLKGGRAGGKPDNCHEDFEGIRKSGDDNAYTAYLEGERYKPYKVEKDSTQKLLYTKVYTDESKYPQRVGCAGVFFRPSFIAGDDYKLQAELDFTGLPNKDHLESIHGFTDVSKRIQRRTGTIRIWRDMKVAVLVNWPARSGSNEWGKIETEFAKSYLNLDTGVRTAKGITQVLQSSEYKTIVADNTSHKKRKIKLLPDTLVGVDLPSQGSMNAAQYKVALKNFVNDNYWNKIYKDLRKKLSENLRKEYPTGFVVVNFLTHKPVNIMNAPPGNKTVSPANSNFVTWSFSIGLPDSVLFIDQKDPDKVYYVVAHEMGHNFWLKHWEHAGGSRAADHDQSDRNCLMSYSSRNCAHLHHRPGTYTPHFCGQCNLKLRGWDVDDPGIPANSN